MLVNTPSQDVIITYWSLVVKQKHARISEAGHVQPDLTWTRNWLGIWIIEARRRSCGQSGLGSEMMENAAPCGS
jgi:hypothetical protein